MSFSGARGVWRRLRTRTRDRFVQTCPPELFACELCRRLDCSSAQWTGCPHRLEAARLVAAGRAAEHPAGR